MALMVKSDGPGLGSQFVVRLPLAEDIADNGPTSQD
jgi:hypothetical protein